MRTAQTIDARFPRKEPQGRHGDSAPPGATPKRPVRVSGTALTALGLAAIVALGACRTRGGGELPPPGAFAQVSVAGSLEQLIRRGDADLRRAAVRRLRDRATEDDIPVLLRALGDENVDVAAAAAFAIAVSGARGTPGRLVAALGEDARPEVVRAAALGLGSRPGDDAERGLLALARRPERPAAVPGALLSHYRWRGRPAQPSIGDPALLDYAQHPEAEGRAGLGHYARAVKDPVLVPILVRLCGDPDAEVRRAAAIGLAPSSAAPWPDDASAAALAGLLEVTSDADAHVVVAACRALSGSDDPRAVAALRGALAHDAFSVRVAAVEGLVRREATDAAAQIAGLAREDGSVAVRAAAATAVAALDPSLAAALADDVLADAAEFVRAAGCNLLAAIPGDGVDTATRRLADLSRDDPHVRVRESALGALEAREGDVVHEAVRRALAADEDPVVVAVACGVAAANGLDDLLPLVRAALTRFPGRLGGDAREGALDALAALGDASDADLLRASVRDESPSVAFAAQKGLATMIGSDPPSPQRAAVRGARPGDMSYLDFPVNLIVETTKGSLTIALDEQAAPLHVAHVVSFARRGGYDGLTWHRVVPDFVIQGGCPRGDGAGHAGVSLPLEPTRIPFERGVLGMPRSSHPDSGGCQLFVMHSRAPHLDVHYTAFGRVIEGLDVIDLIDVDDRIVHVRVVRRSEERR